MAQYIKNDINYHGIKNKVSVMQQGTKEDIRKQREFPDIQMSKFNQEIKSKSCQGLSWEDLHNQDDSTPSSSCNVWEKRKMDFESRKQMEPITDIEEQRMLRKAIDLSIEDAKKKKHEKELEKEYEMQMYLLQSNPMLFKDFLATGDPLLTILKIDEKGSVNAESENVLKYAVPENYDEFETDSTRNKKIPTNRKLAEILKENDSSYGNSKLEENVSNFQGSSYHSKCQTSESRNENYVASSNNKGEFENNSGEQYEEDCVSRNKCDPKITKKKVNVNEVKANVIEVVDIFGGWGLKPTKSNSKIDIQNKKNAGDVNSDKYKTAEDIKQTHLNKYKQSKPEKAKNTKLENCSDQLKSLSNSTALGEGKTQYPESKSFKFAVGKCMLECANSDSAIVESIPATVLQSENNVGIDQLDTDDQYSILKFHNSKNSNFILEQENSFLQNVQPSVEPDNVSFYPYTSNADLNANPSVLENNIVSEQNIQPPVEPDHVSFNPCMSNIQYAANTETNTVTKQNIQPPMEPDISFQPYMSNINHAENIPVLGNNRASECPSQSDEIRSVQMNQFQYPLMLNPVYEMNSFFLQQMYPHNAFFAHQMRLYNMNAQPSFMPTLGYAPMFPQQEYNNVPLKVNMYNRSSSAPFEPSSIPPPTCDAPTEASVLSSQYPNADFYIPPPTEPVHTQFVSNEWGTDKNLLNPLAPMLVHQPCHSISNQGIECVVCDEIDDISSTVITKGGKLNSKSMRCSSRYDVNKKTAYRQPTSCPPFNNKSQNS